MLVVKDLNFLKSLSSRVGIGRLAKPWLEKI